MAATPPAPEAGAAGPAIAAGGSHSCALTSAGAVWCWGSDASGQLGNGGTIPGTDQSVPVSVIGLSSGVAAIAAGGSHTCALTSVGGVKCWGSDAAGQLGDGDDDIIGERTNQSGPVSVIGLSSGVVAIAAGGSHTCALTTVGGVKCWGSDASGQLGNGLPLASQSAPVSVSSLSSGIAAIAAGGSHTCARTTAGALKCWGSDSGGQLGDGGSSVGINQAAPVSVSSLSSGVAAVTAGAEHTCALTTAGAAKCWGRNVSGQIGDGPLATNRTAPVSVSGLSSGVAAMAAGGHHTCARTTDGALKCWGRDASGQLGNGGSLPGSVQTAPVSVIGLDSFVAAIAAGEGHTCAMYFSDVIQCWGEDSSGQLGDGGNIPGTNQPAPVDVGAQGPRVAIIAAGGHHTCARTTAGAVRCWGMNHQGQLGDGGNIPGTDQSAPVSVSGLSSSVATIAAGSHHTCAVTTVGAVKCWGLDDSSQLGDGAGSTQGAGQSAPGDVSGLSSGVATVTAGSVHTCAVTTAGAAKCWGGDHAGQLGDGGSIPDTERSVPVNVSGLSSGVARIAAGSHHTCALTTNGAVKCWGNNTVGQLGDGGNLPGTHQSAPVNVGGLSVGVAGIAAGDAHTCALTTAGAVKCWGWDNSGQLGDGGNIPGTNQSAPVNVSGLSLGVAAIAAGGSHTCALTTAGAVKCWGSDESGQLGDGGSPPGADQSTPVGVIGLSSGVTAIAAGRAHTCAVTTVGVVKCWGEDFHGQLGNGALYVFDQSSPVGVLFLGTTCGDGAVDPGETCDGDPCCNATCTGIMAAGAPCRATVAGGCDVAETCDGASLACPADAIAAAGTTCGLGEAFPCVAGICNGTNKHCEGFTAVAAGTICREAVGDCDVAETCNGGIDISCPNDTFVTAGTICRETAGVCDIAETCNGVAATCPADALAAGTTCREAAGECDVAETCNGAAASCPADAVLPDESPCVDEICTQGICVEGACSATVAIPRSGCRQVRIPLKSSLKILDSINDTGDRLEWAWSWGEATTLADFATPNDAVAGSDYALCVYDESVPGVPQLISRAHVAAGALWTAVPRAAPTSYLFSDRSARQDGITAIQLKPGRDGTANIRVQGKGFLLDTPRLPLAPPTRVQLQVVDGVCFEATFDTAGRLFNTNSTFSGRGD